MTIMNQMMGLILGIIYCDDNDDSNGFIGCCNDSG